MDIIEAFRNKRFVVNCRTEKEAEIFLKICSLHGMFWGNGDKLSDYTLWENYQQNTTYTCNYWGDRPNGITVGDGCHDNLNVISFDKFVSYYGNRLW